MMVGVTYKHPLALPVSMGNGRNERPDREPLPGGCGQQAKGHPAAVKLEDNRGSPMYRDSQSSISRDELNKMILCWIAKEFIGGGPSIHSIIGSISESLIR